MGRIVRSAVVSKGNLEGVADDQGGRNGQGETDSKGGDGYLDRVAKYVPAEVVAFFIFVNSILDNAAEEPVAKALAKALDEKSTDVPGAVRAAIDTVKMAGFSIWNISWIVLIIALAMTPIYLKSVSDSCLLYTSPSPRDRTRSRMPSSA